jgi:simple sugar transport system permease protein
MSQPANVQSVRAERRSSRLPFISGDGSILRLFAIATLLFVGFSLAQPATFPTARNLSSMAFQSSEIGILAIAIGLTMLTGGIDLSVNSTANLTGIITGLVLTRLAPVDALPEQVAGAMIAGIGAAFLVGAICGLFNGFLVAYLGLPAILATLGTLTLYRGIATAITRGSTVFGISASQFIGNGEILGVPVPLIIFLALALLTGVILARSRFGFEVYLLGTNPTAARFSGIDNRAVLMRTYLLSGILAAVAGVVILGRTNSANVDFGGTYVLQAILICVLGGIDPYGGSGRVVGIVLAVASLQFLSTGLNQLLFAFSGANFFKEFAWGALLLIMLLVNHFSRLRRMRPPSAD